MLKYLFFLMFLSLTAFGQDTVLFKDDFQDNRNNWKLWENSKEFYVNIEQGVLHLEKRNKNFDSRGCLWYSQKIDGFDTSKDFSIVLVGKFVSGGDIFEALDIQWGTLAEKNISTQSTLYQLNFFLDGNVRLDFFQSKWDNFNKVNVKEKLEEIAFNPEVFNKYEVSQESGFIRFKINGYEVFKQYVVPVKGNAIGFQHCLKCVWEIEELEVVQKNTLSESIENVMSVEEEGLRMFNENELVIYPNPFVDKFNVKFSLDKKEKVTVYLIDIKGHIVAQETRVLPEGNVDFTIEAAVTDGIYIVRLIAEDNNTLYKRIMRVGASRF